MAKSKHIDDGSLDKNQTKIYKRGRKLKRFGLFLGAGSGKTRIVLRILIWFLSRNKNRNALIVSTKANVLDTWPTQLIEQLSYTKTKLSFHVHHMEYKAVTVPGINCQYSARIHICSYEHLRKLLWHYDNDYFDLLIIDESVRIKNWSAKATGILIAFSQQVSRIYPLSGLPTPNKIEDLFSQVYMIDHGERLGENIGAFRKQFMVVSNYSRFVWFLKGDTKRQRARTEREILKRIKDICVTEQTETFVKDLPKPEYNVVRFELSKKKQKLYRKFARDSIIKLEKEFKKINKKRRKHNQEPKSFSAISAPVLRMKLLQFCSGNIYEDIDHDAPPSTQRKRPHHRTGTERRDAFDKWMKANYKKNDKLIVCYYFTHSIDDILSVLQKRCNPRKIFVVNSKTSTVQLTKDWNDGRIDIIVSHAQSIGHGLNLQKRGGSVFMYQVSDNYDHFYQVFRRIYRRGNPSKVANIYTLCGVNTADELVVSNLNGKAMLGRRVMSAATMLKKVKRLVF